VSLASLAGTACTRADGSSGTVDVTVGADDAVSIACHAADWCAAHAPTVGPHMRVVCDSATQTVTYACDTGWVDLDGDLANGCEFSAPLTPISFNPLAAAAFAARNPLFGGVQTVAVEPYCNGPFEAACPGGSVSSPLPLLSIDGSQRPGDEPRLVMAGDQAHSRLELTARFRMQSLSPIPVTLPVVGACSLSIDTAPGSHPDITVVFNDSVIAPTGPTVVSDVVLSNLESADYSITGGFACSVASVSLASIVDVVQHALTTWVENRGILCGAPEPVYFQRCA
jgi:hypothetical protein